MPSRNRMSMVAPLASGVPSVTVPAFIELLKPPPLGWLGGCSSVDPCTVMFDVPLPHGGRSTVTTTDVDVLGRRSANPDAAGNVSRSMIRKRSRVTLPPVLFVNVRRMSSVPNVELFAGSLVKSRTRLGGLPDATHVSRSTPGMLLLRSTGDARFSGPGAPRRWPAPAEVPLVSTKMKSTALLSVSFGVEIVHTPMTVIEPPLPQVSR